MHKAHKILLCMRKGRHARRYGQQQKGRDERYGLVKVAPKPQKIKDSAQKTRQDDRYRQRLGPKDKRRGQKRIPGQGPQVKERLEFPGLLKMPYRAHIA